MKRSLPLAITFVCGAFMILSFFFNDETAPAEIAGKLKDWCIVLGAFAVVLGTGNIIRVSVHKARKKEDRAYKLVLLFCLAVTTVTGLLFGTAETIAPNPVNKWLSLTDGRNPFDWIYWNFQLPLNATMFSMLVFFITSAAYRAFRMRSVEAGLLLATGVIVMLGQVPEGVPLVGGLLGDMKDWIMDVPNVAAKRAIIMGAAMGVAAMSLRVILGIERSYLGGD